ncbi:MAG TPA: 2-isopropylmalate synthase [Candidatus Hydrogenedentes bacterium]|nr:2-isopropylmalate synthase [Candidatus Hydrogenedentota bacterium]
MSTRVEIFDTTLRDGEQSPGASMDDNQKIEMALQLERLGVDIIEAGFPIASEQEFQSVKAVSETVKRPRIAALARTIKVDIERAASAVADAERPVVHTFIATSPIHMEHKLKLTPDQVLEEAQGAVKYAKTLVERVEFSAEDSTRSEWDFLVKVSQAAIDAGANVINLPDTVGYTTPAEIQGMFEHVIGNVTGADDVIFSCHNHNDLGLAVANALAAVRGGARQVECTVNGIGERAGNTSLEEVVMALKTRSDVMPYETGINNLELANSSMILSQITGLVVPYNKPIVGRNAFAHEAGIHQHGMIANQTTYEIMTPESVGRARSELVLGKHSGRAGLAKRCEELGFNLEHDEVVQLYEKFIELADRKKEVFDDDLRILLMSMRDETFEIYSLQDLNTSGKKPAMALVKLKKGEDETPLTDTAIGDGPVDAACRAIERVVGVSGRLEEFTIRAATPGKDAQGEAHVVVNFEHRRYTGVGASTDIIEAAVLAYLNAMNKYLAISGSNS